MGEGGGYGQADGSGGDGVASPSARSLLAADKKEKHFRKVGKKVRLSSRSRGGLFLVVCVPVISEGPYTRVRVCVRACMR